MPRILAKRQQERGKLSGWLIPKRVGAGTHKQHYNTKDATLNKWTMDLSFDKPPLNLNQRMHWAKLARTKSAIRKEVLIRAKAARLKPAKKITVCLVYRPKVNRRRDPSNFILTQKPILDGLVQAGLVPDDTPEYVNELMPKILPPVKGEPAKCWVDIMLH